MAAKISPTKNPQLKTDRHFSHEVGYVGKREQEVVCFESQAASSKVHPELNGLIGLAAKGAGRGV